MDDDLNEKFVLKFTRKELIALRAGMSCLSNEFSVHVAQSERLRHDEETQKELEDLYALKHRLEDILGEW